MGETAKAKGVFRRVPNMVSRFGRKNVSSPAGRRSGRSQATTDLGKQRYAEDRRGLALLGNLLASVAFLACAVGGVYYFNRLVYLEQNVHAAQAQIERELQRRADLIRSLLPAVYEYAALEREVLTTVTQIRAESLLANEGLARAMASPPAVDGAPPPPTIDGAPPSPPSDGVLPGGGDVGDASIGALLGRLTAVAEQYPDMKSSAPFQILMEKVVEIENRLADERQKYNNEVNTYTTATATFPGRVFAQVFDFPDHALFSADEQARALPPIAWREERTP